jgi:eukaryotic-like serine/threonine-protein kinase
VLCPSCQSENDDAAEVCFNCRAVLTAVTRGTLIASRYRILAPLGRGGMGAVYRAHDEVLDEEVALKILRPEVAGTPEMAARFRSEIKLARKVSHWNVCRIHEYGEEAGLQYISMELISGATLKDRLRSGPLPSDQAFDVAIQIAEGLAAIHKVGIIHRDLKSPNVMIDGEGTAKVMDFGIAKPASAGTDGASTGYVLGSPEYMSPEQARGRRADFRSDLYSLGIVVFEAFTGRVPFRGATPVETLMMHVEAPPPLDDPALALPPALLPVLRSALAKDPAARFPDAASMAAALRAARGGAVPGADASRTEVVRTRRLPVAERRRRPAVALALGAVVAVVVVAAALLTRRDREGALVPSTLPSAAANPSAPAVAGATPALPYTLAPDTTVARPPARVPESAPTALRASPTLGPPSPAGVSTPRPMSPAAVAAGAPSPTAAPSTPAAVPSTAPPSPREATVVPTAPAPPPATPAPPVQGWLLVLPKPWAEVTVDGRALGPTPLDRIPLAPGSHAVILTHPQYQPFTRKVEIRPGEVFRLRWDFPQDGVKRR